LKGHLILQLQHNKEYKEDEDKMRFEIFKQTLKTIEEHNAKHAKVSARLIFYLIKY
jgi:hypothetical protein